LHYFILELEQYHFNCDILFKSICHIICFNYFPTQDSIVVERSEVLLYH